jgi:hypothetical protein
VGHSKLTEEIFSEKLEIYFHFRKMVKITQKSRNSESKTNTL